MATTTTKSSSSSSSPTLRFLGFLKQPDPTQSESDPTNTDLDENDVVWSYIPSSSPSPRPLNPNPRRRINPVQSGLSAALNNNNDRRQFTAQKPKEIPVSANIPARLNQSAPMNIPVWPKKFREVSEFDEVDLEECEESEIVPPHVIVARSHLTFSVFEGVGRTLKGRDLRRVRNAVFRKTGFLD